MISDAAVAKFPCQKIIPAAIQKPSSTRAKRLCVMNPWLILGTSLVIPVVIGMNANPATTGATMGVLLGWFCGFAGGGVAQMVSDKNRR